MEDLTWLRAYFYILHINYAGKFIFLKDKFKSYAFKVYRFSFQIYQD